MFAQDEPVIVVVTLKHTYGAFVSKISKNVSVSVLKVSVSVSASDQESKA